jgi:large subunit ribosomal protein L4
MVETLKTLVGESSALILLPDKSDDYRNVVISSRNLQDAKTLLVNYLNIRDLLGYDRIVLPLKALESISAHLG